MHNIEGKCAKEDDIVYLIEDCEGKQENSWIRVNLPDETEKGYGKYNLIEQKCISIQNKMAWVLILKWFNWKHENCHIDFFFITKKIIVINTKNHTL